LVKIRSNIAIGIIPIIKIIKPTINVRGGKGKPNAFSEVLFAGSGMPEIGYL
jgi:hypothetical protein